MTPLFIAFMIAFAIFTLAIFRLMYVNSKTFKQRKQLIEFVWMEGNEEFQNEMYRVSYERHLRTLFLFRDPWQLYHPRVTKAMTASKRNY